MLATKRPGLNQTNTVLCPHSKKHSRTRGPPWGGAEGGWTQPPPPPRPASGQQRGGKRRRYLVDGGVLPQRQVPEAAAHLVPALAHCKGRERHGSGTGRGRRGGALAATAPYPAPPPTGPWRAAAAASAFELGARKPRPLNGRGGRAFLTTRPPSPRLPPAVERPIRWHTCGRSPPTRREWNIPLGSGEGGCVRLRLACSVAGAWARLRPAGGNGRQSEGAAFGC